MRWPEIVGIFDSETGVGDGIEDLVIEDVVIADEGAEHKIEDEIIAEIEVSLQVTHIVQRFDKVMFQ